MASESELTPVTYITNNATMPHFNNFIEDAVGPTFMIGGLARVLKQKTQLDILIR